MKRIAIVGANSFIGRNVIYVLKQKEGMEFKLYDYSPKQIDSEENYYQIDILSRTSIKKIDLDCDVVFLFVGKTGSVNGFDEYDDFLNINERALLNLLNEYRRQKSKAKIIFPSTRLVYRGATEPQKETADKEFKTIYAMNKFACEQYLQQYNRVFGIKYCIFRISVPYGSLIPGASSYGTAEFMLGKAKKGQDISLYGDGSVRRTLTYIGDLANTLIEGAFADGCMNDVYNIGGEDYSLKEMAEVISEKYNVGIQYIPWPEIAEKIESGNTVFNDDKLQKVIGNTVMNKFVDFAAADGRMD